MLAPIGRPEPESAPEPNSQEPKLFGFVFFGLLAALVWAPLPLGSNRQWATALLTLWLWGLLLAVVAGGLAKPQQAALWWPRLKRAWLPLMLLAGFAAVPVLQLLPWPAGLREQLLPLAVPPANTAAGPLTLDAFATQRHLLSTLGYLAAFALVVMLAHTRHRVQWLLGTLVAGGVLQALIAVALYSGGGHYQYFFYEFKQGGRATGTFPNPDHLAGYMELTLAAGLGLMMAQFGGSTQAPRHWRARLLEAMHFILSAKMLLRLMLVVMVVALVMTHSRMGNGAFFLAMLLAGAAVAVISPRLRRVALWLVLSMVVVDAIIIGQWVGLERVVERVQGTALTDEVREEMNLEQAQRSYREETLEGRMQAPLATFRLMADAPMLGHGAGTFFTAFPPFKGPTVYPTFFDHAHNDYAEVGAETGWIGLACWIALGLASGLTALRLLRDSQPRLQRGVGVAAGVALFALGLHSLVDFNMQIPANALTMTCLLAAVWAVAQLNCTSTRRRNRTAPASDQV